MKLLVAKRWLLAMVAMLFFSAAVECLLTWREERGRITEEQRANFEADKAELDGVTNLDQVFVPFSARGK